MKSETVIHLHDRAPPPPPQASVADVARDLRVDFRPASLQLSVVRLAQHVHELQARITELERREAERNQSCFAWLRERFRR
jgi:hypothetical protein